MQWTMETFPDRLIGKPTGRVDEGSWELFTESLIVAVRAAKAAGSPLVVDLSALDYMVSRGLRALTLAKREADPDTALILAAPNERMREILQISRYDKMFRVVASVAEAV